MWTPIQKRFHKKLRDTFTKNALFPAPWSSRRTSLSASVPPRPQPSRRRPPYASLPRASSHTDDPGGDGGDPAGPHPHPSQPPAVAGPPSSPDPAVKSVPSHQPHALAHADSAASEAAGGSVRGSPAAGAVSHDASQMRRPHGLHGGGGAAAASAAEEGREVGRAGKRQRRQRRQRRRRPAKTPTRPTQAASVPPAWAWATAGRHCTFSCP